MGRLLRTTLLGALAFAAFVVAMLLPLSNPYLYLCGLLVALTIASAWNGSGRRGSAVVFGITLLALAPVVAAIMGPDDSSCLTVVGAGARPCVPFPAPERDGTYARLMAVGGIAAIGMGLAWLSVRSRRADPKGSVEAST